ncbi:multiple sugar transport system permease protein [Gracilibacillus halotolerans]|uniref:Multiple sugar transport system permease protein n=1 Tax=Gracilibacillus halotolerans TaxID=74386 RepID=A0A841RGT0_9BACI|nr:carbohydrate ABC transporter permease [Gracilibacillus halotolerans]MBB6513350.1 multiple sugar transport system permease protein [Gracilibacillus halotolerans]
MKHTFITKKSFWLNVIGVIIALVYLFPIYWMVITSFKTQSEIFQVPPTLFPKDFSLASYTGQLGAQLFGMVGNSFIIAFSAMVIVLLTAVPAAYALARYRMKLTGIIMLFFLVTQMLPATVVLAPLFISFEQLNVLNTYIAPILATTTLGIPFSVLILRPYFLSAPVALEEAALIDGASKFRAFFTIILPIVRPGIFVAGAISFLFAWGDLIFSLTFIRDQSLWPLTAGMYNAIGQYGVQYNFLMAFATISVIPVVVIFLSLQQHLVKGLTAGSVK